MKVVNLMKKKMMKLTTFILNHFDEKRTFTTIAFGDHTCKRIWCFREQQPKDTNPEPQVPLVFEHQTLNPPKP